MWVHWVPGQSNQVGRGRVTEAEDTIGLGTDTINGLEGTRDCSCGEQREAEEAIRREMAVWSTRTYHHLSEQRAVAVCRHVSVLHVSLGTTLIYQFFSEILGFTL